MDAILAGILGAAVGAAIPAVGSIISLCITRRSDERKHVQSLAMQIAMDQWKTDIELAKSEPAGAYVAPFETYILHGLKVIDLCSSETSEADIRAGLQRSRDLCDAIMKDLNDHKQKRGKDS